MKKKDVRFKEFPISTWAIKNKMTIYVLMFVILFMGISSFFGMPRETFPEIVETKIYISTVFPGNTAEDVEKLITQPIEDQLRNLSGVNKITSNSQEDYSMIIVEFSEDFTIQQALLKVKDEVDTKKSGEDWPTFNGAKVEPNIFNLSISEEQPILNIGITGDYTIQKLKEYGEYLKDRIELLPQIKQVDIRGVQDREVAVEVDIYKMTASKISFGDVINAISRGNTTISAGNMILNNQRRTIRIIGEVDNYQLLENFVVKNERGPIYIRDIATVTFKEKDKTTYAREYLEPVVLLNVKKLSGKNMIEATNSIKEIIKDTRENHFPSNIKITTSNDQSDRTIGQVDDLVNNILFGIILVIGVLMFFLGLRNAIFVGIAIPLSMLLSLVVLKLLGYTMNTMVLFALVMGLGMLVDNGIVVVENVYRLMAEEGMSRTEAAKKGIGEIATPIIISTATTVGAFIPLGLWPGIMGKFMIFFPITLSVVLGSSLVVALLINSMLTSQFMKVEESKITNKRLIIVTSSMLAIGFLFIWGDKTIGTLLFAFALLAWFQKFVAKPVMIWFQVNILARIEIVYRATLRFALKSWHPFAFVFGTFLLLIFSFILVGIAQPKVEFFPDNEPNMVYVYIEYPEGTDIEKTNKITLEIEKKVLKIVDNYIDKGNYNFMVESMVSQVGEGAGNPFTDAGSSAKTPNKSRITLLMRESKLRRGVSSRKIHKEISEALYGYVGVKISVEKEANGPPTGYPINIEIRGIDYNELIRTAEFLKYKIQEFNVAGIEALKIDVNKNKPGAEIIIDREKAGELGISNGQIGNIIRNSLFGAKAGVYKKDGDDYDIYVRFNSANRYNRHSLLNQRVIFRDPSNGKVKDIPISTLVKKNNTSSFSSIKHRDAERVVTLYSAVSPGFNANEIVNNLKELLKGVDVKEGISYRFTGEIEEQEKNMSFLTSALIGALMIIFILLVLQFNSVSKPLIIMMSIFLSFIGVLFGLVIFNMKFVIIMTMVGIISLAGIVVNNAVVLLDYTQLLIDRKKQELEIGQTQRLPLNHITEAIINGGKARLRPVLLTAITTILGLIPLAIGLNIDFVSFLSNWNPNFYLGGDNVIFWGPLAWTVIFGLSFATFLTLVIVPVSFYIVNLFKAKIYPLFGK
jgi:multidrug efflux pump subunit AcrB